MANLGRPKTALVLSADERATLTSMARAIRRNRHGALRARIVLACSESLSNREVAARLGLAEHTVGKWRARFVAHRLAGLANAPAAATAPSAPRLPSALPFGGLFGLGAWHLGALLGLGRAAEPAAA